LAHKHEATTLGSKFFTFPNLLTIARLILIAPIVLAILTNNMIPAALLVALSFGTDVADGRIARYLKQESALGRMLDFTADRLNLICLLSSLFIVGVFPWWALALIIGREAVMITYNLYLKIKGLPFVPPTPYGKATYVIFFIMEFSYILNLYPLNLGSLIAAFVLMPLSLASSLQKFFKTIREA
jgi:cardiolipin synthase